MIVMALIAAAIKAVCVWLLARLCDPDVNIRAANTFSWNDFAANLGIVIAGGFVIWLGTNWPDLVVGVIVPCIATWCGVVILKDAHGEHQKAVHTDDHLASQRPRIPICLPIGAAPERRPQYSCLQRIKRQ